MAFDLKAYAAAVRVTDGAWGTELQKAGLMPGSAPELWNWKEPQTVEAVARSYVQAGSDVILTNTFGANRFILATHGLTQRTAELAEQGVLISRRAADAAGRDVKVFASMGPSGKIVMTGDVAAEELAAGFAEAAEALAWGGADALLLESFAELDEVRIALKAVRQACALPVVVSMTFASGPDGTATMMGDKPGDLAKVATALGAAAVGANCGVGPDNYVKVAQLLREATPLPLWIKANAGLPVIEKGKTVFPMGPKVFADYVPKLVAAGAAFIGGCCGTTPQHIAAVRAAVDGEKK